MAKQSKTNLRRWFETDDKPDQQQFWDWLDSYYHKDEGVILSQVVGLGGGKFQLQFSDGQTITINATSSASKIITIDKWQVFKHPLNSDLTAIQNNDVIKGWFNNDRFGTYLVTNAADITNEANIVIIDEFNKSE